MSSVKWRLFFLDLNELMGIHIQLWMQLNPIITWFSAQRLCIHIIIIIIIIIIVIINSLI